VNEWAVAKPATPSAQHITYLTVRLQGYLAHKKTPPLGPYRITMRRALWWS